MKFILDGEKLRGEFALVKTGWSDKSWLLLKKKDRYAITKDILAENHSVVSDNTLEDLSDGDSQSSVRQKRNESGFAKQ